MSPDKWKTILGNIKDNFQVFDEGRSKIDEEGGIQVDFIEFGGPLGRMRLEYVVKPVILDKKTTYSRRIGSETKVDYVYSDEEMSHQLMAYKWDDAQNDWVEMDSASFE